MIVSRFSRPSGERRPSFTLPETMCTAGHRLTLVEDDVPAREIDGLKRLTSAATAEGSTPWKMPALARTSSTCAPLGKNCSSMQVAALMESHATSTHTKSTCRACVTSHGHHGEFLRSVSMSRPRSRQEPADRAYGVPGHSITSPRPFLGRRRLTSLDLPAPVRRAEDLGAADVVEPTAPRGDAERGGEPCELT